MLWGALPGKRLPLRFSDGSRVWLDGGSQGKVRKASSDRVVVALDEGGLEGAIRTRPGVAWTFEAGPYRVGITGTRFKIRWAPRSEHLLVEVSEGRVTVTGPGLRAGGVDIEEGRRLEIGAWEEVATVGSAPLLKHLDRPPEALDEPVRAKPRALPGGRQRRGSRHGVPPWKKLYREGKYRAALDAAVSGRDFAKLIESLDPPDLIRLIHSARYARDAKKARLALFALKRRFPKSPQARVVPFLLGRLALEIEGDPREAAGWFRAYLAGEPEGEFSDEARGRLMESLDRAGDKAAARRAAGVYLRRHPDGPYAEAARLIVGGR